MKQTSRAKARPSLVACLQKQPCCHAASAQHACSVLQLCASTVVNNTYWLQMPKSPDPRICYVLLRFIVYGKKQLLLPDSKQSCCVGVSTQQAACDATDGAQGSLHLQQQKMEER
jgi:hypothetical protein